MSNDLAVFAFPASPNVSHDIRVITLDNVPWFLAVDVCRALGLSTYAGTTVHLNTLHPSERRRETPSSLNRILGRNLRQGELPSNSAQALITYRIRGNRGQSSVFMTEAGLYRLLMRSDKAAARPFQDWVTGKVLPSIRKNGGYIVGQEKLETGEMTDAEFLAKALMVATKTMAIMTQLCAAIPTTIGPFFVQRVYKVQ